MGTVSGWAELGWAGLGWAGLGWAAGSDKIQVLEQAAVEPWLASAR